jgi:predicted NBD/HSP70 family sugar kinase
VREPAGSRKTTLATPRSIRYLNEMRALNALFHTGGMSRADLSRLLGLNRSSVGFIIHDLLADGLARESKTSLARARGEARAGRPGVMVELNPRGATFLGVEIGVEHITIVAIDLATELILHRSITYSTRARTPPAGIAKAAELINAAIETLGGATANLRGVCVTIPALVRDGVVRNALMLGWRDVQLRKELKECLPLDVPVVIENDANAFAIGETYRGASTRSDCVAFLLIENGAGGGIVLGGRLVRGATGFAGEFGQLPIGGEGYRAGPHGAGHLESYIGKDAVIARYRANGASPKASFHQLVNALREGEPIAMRTANDWAQKLAVGLVQLTNVLAPGLIILGGSVAELYGHVGDRVRTLMQSAFLEGFPVPKIELSRLGPEGAAFGGACLLHQAMFSVDERLLHSQGDPAKRPRHARSRTEHLSLPLQPTVT